MPFTFSHPALIIPLLRRHRRLQWVSATGLITGSLAPDFEKFFRLELASGHSHTPTSIFYFSVPVALALAFLFHGVVRRPLLAHLPAPLYRRLAHYAPFDWPTYFRLHAGHVLLCIILGAALHLGWDFFTHQNELMVSLFNLNNPAETNDWSLSLFDVLGLLSSAGGGLAIAWAVWQMPARLTGPVPAAAAVRRYWSTVGLVAAALLGQWVLMTQPRLLSVAITAITTTMIGVVAASLYATYASRRPRLTPGPRPR